MRAGAVAFAWAEDNKIAEGRIAITGEPGKRVDLVQTRIRKTVRGQRHRRIHLRAARVKSGVGLRKAGADEINGGGGGGENDLRSRS